MKNSRSYRLDIKYSRNNGEQSNYYFKKIFNLNYLSEPHRKILYDPQAKIYFESNEIIIPNIEIETEDVYVEFPKKQQKLEDFYRRINYHFDWAQISIDNETGRVSSIINIEELKNNWSEIKSLLERDYESSELDDYVKKISDSFSSDNDYEKVFKQPFYFGLIFPPIPHRHSVRWNTMRKFRIWENSEIEFIETITFDKKENTTRYYSLQGKLVPYLHADLLTYTGKIDYSSLDKTVNTVSLSISYKLNQTINDWEFTLKRIRI